MSIIAADIAAWEQTMAGLAPRTDIACYSITAACPVRVGFAVFRCLELSRSGDTSGFWAPLAYSSSVPARAARIPFATLKNWEQGRRHPDAPAAAYLLAIKRKPKEIKEAVAH
jgi:hypothetical protein